MPPFVPPPDATSLITSAPSATSMRTLRRISSGVSATPPDHQMCPALWVIARPANCSRGPTKKPRRIASRTQNIVWPRAAQSRTVVTPERKWRVSW
jgi:hypothetical protein